MGRDGDNIIIFGGAGFLGTNLFLTLKERENYHVTVVDKNNSFYCEDSFFGVNDGDFITGNFDLEMDFDAILEGQDVVYHLVSTTVPTTSNAHISEELTANVVVTSRLLEACVRNNIKKVIFLSSGGTVYGKETDCPLTEETPTYPISSYGIQKITIEKLLYLYNYLYGLDYRIIRLSNPYGPYQKPNGVQGVVTTFIYQVLKGDTLNVYGDGSVIRDFIYVDDAIEGIIKISDGDSKYKTFNLGSGIGTSIKELIKVIRDTLGIDFYVKYFPARKVDVPVNYLDINRFESEYGSSSLISLSEGILKTAKFLEEKYL